MNLRGISKTLFSVYRRLFTPANNHSIFFIAVETYWGTYQATLQTVPRTSKFGLGVETARQPAFPKAGIAAKADRNRASETLPHKTATKRLTDQDASPFELRGMEKRLTTQPLGFTASGYQANRKQS